MTANILSFISRRTELYKFIPHNGTLLELQSEEAAFEIPYLSEPKGFQTIDRVTVRDIVDLETVSGHYHAVLILAGTPHLEFAVAQAAGLVLPRGVIGIAAEDKPPQYLANIASLGGFQPMIGVQWTVGEGSYLFARKD